MSTNNFSKLFWSQPEISSKSRFSYTIYIYTVFGGWRIGSLIMAGHRHSLQRGSSFTFRCLQCFRCSLLIRSARNAAPLDGNKTARCRFHLSKLYNTNFDAMQRYILTMFCQYAIASHNSHTKKLLLSLDFLNKKLMTALLCHSDIINF